MIEKLGRRHPPSRTSCWPVFFGATSIPADCNVNNVVSTMTCANEFDCR